VKSVASGSGNDDGEWNYAITNLQPGRYSVSAEATGFPGVQQLADVPVARPWASIRMRVGAVSAAPVGSPLIITEISQTVTGNEVLALATRNPRLYQRCRATYPMRILQVVVPVLPSTEFVVTLDKHLVDGAEQ
jgi:hypothetical protein